jgi:hypothetical protein
MSMRAIFLAAGTAALVTGLYSAPALASTSAATKWTITPGGAFGGSSGTFVLTDTKTGTKVTCSSSTLGATLKSGTVSGSLVGDVTSLGLTSCTASLGAFTLTVEKLPWDINFTSLKSGVVTGDISGVVLEVSGAGCSASVGGTTAGSGGQADFKYTPSAGKLAVSGGTLHFEGVSGCLGLFADGDPATITVTYKVPKETVTES